MAADHIRVVVAGTNGKSTTTGLLGHLLYNSDQSSFMAGAVLQDYETNFAVGDGHYFVFEGDEYKALYDDPTPKFHLYQPDILLLTNLELDHPDVFASLEDLKDEFRHLLANIPEDGLVLYNGDDANLTQLIHESNVAAFSFGLHNAVDFKAESIRYKEAVSEFTLTRLQKGEVLWTEEYTTQLAGEMNVYNALGPIALLRALGFQPELIQRDLTTYRGVKRRFEFIGEHSGVKVFDDYAHHPTAVGATLAAARTRFPDACLWAVFEPHTFSRTEATLPELAHCFSLADRVLLAEVYPAREHKTAQSITGEQVVAAIRPQQPAVELVADKAAALTVLRRDAKPGDVVIIMAVGSFNTLAQELVNG